MVRISAAEFAKRIITTADKFGLQDLKVSLFEDIILKIRINLEKLHLDVFYNAKTEKVSYALIKEGKRIFGADNTGRWHKHPFDKPENHINSKEISFEDFLKETLKFVEKK